jgi:hypothetical protein
LPPNRGLRFRLSFERRLAAPGGFREALREALAGLPGGGIETGADSLAAFRSHLLVQFEQALNGGPIPRRSPGETIREGGGALFEPGATDDAVAAELRELTRDLGAAEAARREAVERWREVSRSLEGQLAAIAGSEDLAAVLAALESRPETDPRDASGPLALGGPARRLVGLEAAARAAEAAGRPPRAAALDLDAARQPAEAEGVAERYRATAGALQELREWAQALAYAAGDARAAEDLVRRGDLRPSALEGLRRLAARPQGALHRAERWAEAQAATAQDVARALRARDQAAARAAAELETRALGVTLRDTLVSEPAATDAGVYVGLDLGVLYPPELERASLTLGANLYFRPVNKRASLRSHGSFGHRFSLTVGLTLNDLKLEEGDPRFEPLLGERSNLILGAGLRVTRSLRLSAGALLFLKNDENPLVEDRSLAATFYAGLSFDVDLVGAFRAMGQ